MNQNGQGDLALELTLLMLEEVQAHVTLIVTVLCVHHSVASMVGVRKIRIQEELKFTLKAADPIQYLWKYLVVRELEPKLLQLEYQDQGCHLICNSGSKVDVMLAGHVSASN